MTAALTIPQITDELVGVGTAPDVAARAAARMHPIQHRLARPAPPVLDSFKRHARTLTAAEQVELLTELNESLSTYGGSDTIARGIDLILADIAAETEIVEMGPAETRRPNIWDASGVSL